MHYFPTILSSLRQTVTARRTACSILWLLPPVTAFYLMQLVYGGSLRFSPGVVLPGTSTFINSVLRRKAPNAPLVR